MGWIISMIFAVLVSGTLFLVGRALRRSGDPDVASWGLGLKIAAPVVFLLWAGLHTGFASVNQVPAGSVGVVYQFGSITGQVPEGLQIVAPWNDVKIANIQVQKHQFEKLNAFSKETQDVFIVATLNYEVSPGAIQNLYRTVGPNYFEKLVASRVNQNFKDETVKYESINIAPNREVIRQAVRDRLVRELKPFSINVVDLLIDDIDFRPEFKEAIEAKQIATQQALEEAQKVEKARQQALQMVETATGEAAAVRIAADAQAYSNNAINQSLTPDLIRFQMIQRLADNIKIALIPSLDNIILDSKSLFEEKE